MESDLTAHLIPINDTNEIPSNVYRVCDLEGSPFYIKKPDYNNFCDSWIDHSRELCLSMQLYTTPNHALYFDIDFKAGKLCDENRNIYNDSLLKFETSLKWMLIPKVHDFTIIYTGSNSYGVHLYLPEFTIAHDDYLEMCKQLQLMSIFSDKGPLYLKAPVKWSFPRIGYNPEAPYKMSYFSEGESFNMIIKNFTPSNKEPIEKKFKRLVKNNESFFRRLLSLKSKQYKDYLYKLMMPVIVDFKPRHKIGYITNIINDTCNNVATIFYHNEGQMGYVIKSKSLSFNDSNFLSLYQNLKHQAFNIKNIDTDNTAIKSWFEMFSVNSNDNEQPLFKEINVQLRFHNSRLFPSNKNPLAIILEYDNGYFFFPVFFALVKHLGLKAPDLVSHLRLMFTSPKIQSFLSRLENLNEEYVDSISETLTLNTICFCAHNMTTKKTKTFQEKLIDIVQNSKYSILGVCSPEQMSDLILKIQDLNFPLKVLTQSKNTNNKSAAYIWKPLKHCWIELTNDKERNDHLSNLWQIMKNFITNYRKSGETGGPDEATVKGLNLNSVSSTLSSNKSMEEETIEMDAHKWFIRLKQGYMIDLLTGHVGAIVPEFYMSNRAINIDMPRPQMIEYLNESPTALMKQLYNLLVDEKFFTHFLEQLLLDVTDDIYDTASLIVSKELMSIEWEKDDYAKSMLQFYVHLCKFVSFEYDLLMYMLDVLASTMIATNYDRKFFVCKGPTNNGKSVLFEIIGAMFGPYFRSILSDNLQKTKSSSNSAPTPDLALTLFNCRILAMEELESNFSENRIKQLTGNSRVAFRSLFKDTESGVPTAKVFVTTNNIPDCLVTQAFRERVVVLPFNSTFQDNAPTKTSERVMQCLYPKEEYVVKTSYKGSFFLLYFHLRNCIKPRKGLLPYRKKPECVIYYTNEYLKNTNVYGKFKSFMDVQIIPNTMTTVTDLSSAVREFVKDKKANQECENEIKIQFEKEFSEYRRIEKNINITHYEDIFSTADVPLTCTNKSLINDSSSDEEDEVISKANSFKRKRPSSFENDLTPRKKQKQNEDDDIVVFYENVWIKNYKKKFTEF